MSDNLPSTDAEQARAQFDHYFATARRIVTPRDRLIRGIDAGMALENAGHIVYWNGVNDPHDSHEAMRIGLHGPVVGTDEPWRPSLTDTGMVHGPDNRLVSHCGQPVFVHHLPRSDPRSPRHTFVSALPTGGPIASDARPCTCRVIGCPEHAR